jgi:hypothetical protein
MYGTVHPKGKFLMSTGFPRRWVLPAFGLPARSDLRSPRAGVSHFALLAPSLAPIAIASV